MQKINRSHKTYIESAEKIIKFLNKHPLVSKISLGIIKSKNPPSKTISKSKIILHKTHLLLKINSKLANQEIRVYGKTLEILKNDLEK